MTEYWDIYDKNGNKTGLTVKRKDFKNSTQDKYHLVTHVWVVNSKGEFLIQKRSPDKIPMPGEWAANSGSAFAGEDSKTAAIREIGEELGICIKPDEIKFIKRIIKRNSLCDIWKIGLDCTLDSLTFQKEEVSEAKWVSPEKLKEMIENKQFHDYGADYFEIIFNEL